MSMAYKLGWLTIFLWLVFLIYLGVRPVPLHEPVGEPPSPHSLSNP